jgi:hypothetical protein
MKTLKVYGGETYRNFGQIIVNRKTRAIVAAYTKKQASEIANVSQSTFRDYWSETGNDKELATAIEVGMWIYNNDHELVKVNKP